MPMILLLSGPIGSGKSELADRLERYDSFARYRTSGFLLQRANSRNVSRSDLQTFSDNLDETTDHQWVFDDFLVASQSEKNPNVVVRDQIPMDDNGLRRALPDYMTPADWYKSLNQKVFFWLTQERLLKLLGAGAYRNKRHDVIELDTRALFEANQDRIWLCPINSGCTKPFPHPRDEKTFRRIADYPYADWRKKRKAGERVVELSVDYSVPNLRDFVTRVVEMQGDTQLRVIFP